jgi:hypothetical protein
LISGLVDFGFLEDGTRGERGEGREFNFGFRISDLPSVNSPAKVGGASCFAPVRISDIGFRISSYIILPTSNFGFTFGEFAVEMTGQVLRSGSDFGLAD